MNRVLVIAEAGVNHNGDINIAKKLVDVAVDSGADAVKFQTFKADTLVCKDAKKASYQLKTTDSKESQFEMIKRLELTKEMHDEISLYCKEKGIKFLSTPFDVDSIWMLEEYEMDFLKIPSGEITNYPFLREAALTGRNIILSTGMSTLEEVENAIMILEENKAGNIILLHCNTEYPTPMKDVNLKGMCTLKEFGRQVGYSDHTEGIEVAIAAVALGASVIEKHFTLDKEMEGPDHKASIEPKELKELVKAIRNIEMALGDGRKRPSASEIKNREIVRKSIVAKCDISKGTVLSEENITTKRPGTGISPMEWKRIIGTTAKEDYKKDEKIT